MRIYDLEKLFEFAPPQQDDPENQPQEELPPQDVEPEEVPVEPQATQTPAEPQPDVPAEPQQLKPTTSPQGSIAQNLEPGIFKPEPVLTKDDIAKIKQVEKLSTSLISKAKRLNEKNPIRKFAFKVIQTFAYLDDNLSESVEKTELDLIKAASLKVAEAFKRGGGTSVDDLIRLLTEANNLTADELAIEAAQSKEYKKSIKAHDTYVKLTAYEELVQKDKDLERLAQIKARNLNLPLRWARNLIGMFGASMDKDARNQFVEECVNGTAIDLDAMLSAGQGKVDDFVKEGDVKEVYESIKHTLLDISLSDGQGAATGPFEALLAIMGGAKKAPTGDLLIGGDHYEVKSSSITLKSTQNKSGRQLSGGNSNAWLDSGGEQAPAKTRAMLKGVIANNTRVALPEGADFRPGLKVETGPLSLMKKFFDNKNVGAKGITIIRDFHATMYPAVYKGSIPNYSFNESCKRIYRAILGLDAAAIAKEQGVMAMLEYNMGHYQSNFILYNSSTQYFRVIKGPEEIAGILDERPGDRFSVSFMKATITVGTTSATTRKSAPGIYFGPEANSQEGEAYVNAKRAEAGIAVKVKKAEQLQTDWEKGIDHGGYLPGNELGEPVGKKKTTTKSVKRALKEVDSYLLNQL
mgnify:CR=1 FL=1